mgnify:FL=1
MRLLLSVLFIFLAGCSDIVAPQEYYPFEIETRLERDDNGYYHFPMESYSSTQALVRFTAHTHNPEIQFVYWDCDTQWMYDYMNNDIPVDIINHSSYTDVNGEANTMFGPQTWMAGDTVQVFVGYLDSIHDIEYFESFYVILESIDE